MVAFRAPKGLDDYVPPASESLLAVRDAMVAPLRLAGYAAVELPVFEETGLFARGVGETTDVVSKEMFSFQDRGGRSMTLRPEGTVGTVRAALEAGLERGQLPVKLWYAGPMFRAENVQAGRRRQFTQVGAEALGSDDPALDAELVALADRAYRSLGLTRPVLHLATLGDPEDRREYSGRLREWLRERVGGLDEETDRRIELNPLRVLDDKRPEVRERTADAPLLTDVVGDAARAHHDAVRRHLTDLGVPYVDDPRLVRGLDYYRRTTFEFIHPLLGAQSTIGAGGRYDGLSEAIGGPPLSGVGWALGVDRTLLALEAEGVLPEPPARAQVFFVPLGADAKARAVTLVGQLRHAGVAADLAYGDRGLKGAMKAADRSGAAFAVVLGERDLAGGVAQVKSLGSGEQDAVPLETLVTVLE
ncbi:MAG TPA: histidine--tRNA ligase, partial [Mycobacteriales bacterium]|nr:histidine--tRNA ligase [Mycobacteriales bacterium]